MKPRNSIYFFSGYSISYRYGVAWFRVRGYGLLCKAPWSLVLFSEREGYRKFYGFRGWRFSILKPTG